MLTGLDLYNVQTVQCLRMPWTFQWRCSQSCLYCDETTWRQWWKIPLENLWKCHFRDSIFLSVPRCLSPQELVPLVWVSKAAYYSLSACYFKSFWQPWTKMNMILFLFLVNLLYVCVFNFQCEGKEYNHKSDMWRWVVFFMKWRADRKHLKALTFQHWSTKLWRYEKTLILWNSQDCIASL